MINRLSWTPLNIKEGQQENRRLNRSKKKKILIAPWWCVAVHAQTHNFWRLWVWILGCFLQRWPQPISSLHPCFSSSASASLTSVNVMSSTSTSSLKPITSQSTYSSCQYLTRLLRTRTPTHSFTSLWSSSGSVSLELTASVTLDAPVPSPPQTCCGLHLKIINHLMGSRFLGFNFDPSPQRCGETDSMVCCQRENAKTPRCCE